MRRDGTEFPDRADDHADRAARATDVHGLPAGHHRRASVRSTSFARVARAAARGGGRGAEADPAQFARRRAAADHRRSAQPGSAAGESGGAEGAAPGAIDGPAAWTRGDPGARERPASGRPRRAGARAGPARARPRLADQVEWRRLPAERLPEQVEAAAYYVVAEALANVQKHAGASRVIVHASTGENRLGGRGRGRRSRRSRRGRRRTARARG